MRFYNLRKLYHSDMYMYTPWNHFLYHFCPSSNQKKTQIILKQIVWYCNNTRNIDAPYTKKLFYKFQEMSSNDFIWLWKQCYCYPFKYSTIAYQSVEAVYKYFEVQVILLADAEPWYEGLDLV